MKRKITFLVVAVLCLQTLLAQNKTIRGTIVDSFSEPIIGASAHVKGTYTGTISDLNGNYTLENVPEDAVITFSYTSNPQLSSSASFLRLNVLSSLN